MTRLAWLANAAWQVAAQPAARRFARAIHACEEVQRAKLKNYLRSNAETAYGRRHCFSEIRSAEAYFDRVPVSSYSDMEPWINRIIQGETSVLTYAPVSHFALTAGTGGPAKTIPYNGDFKGEFWSAVSVWIDDSFRTLPDLRNGPAYWSVSPALGQRRTPAGIPIGFEDDSAYLGGISQILMNRILAVPGHVGRIQDLDASRRITAALLLRSPDLRLISVWHPRFFSLLCDWMGENWETLLRDLHDGQTWPVGFSGNPARAKELSALGPEDPTRFWPGLGLISTWGNGAAKRPFEELAGRFPGVTFQPKGIIATEAFLTFPYRGKYPLAVTSHFFELELEDGTCRPCWKLEPGMKGAPVVTTGGGFYRYRIEDILEVTEHLGSIPCLRFLAKRGHVSDLVGEKLDEAFVERVLDNLLGKRRPEFAMLAPEGNTAQDRYVLYITASAQIDTAHLAETLDLALSENVHYKLARRLGQLERSTVCIVSETAQADYFHRMTMERSQKLGDIKPLVLSPLSNWGAWLKKKDNGMH